MLTHEVAATGRGESGRLGASGAGTLGRASAMPSFDGREAADLVSSPDRLGADRRRSRRQGVLLAVLLMLVGAAGSVYLASAGRPRVDVVALAHPVARGDVIRAGDLATVRLAVDGGRVRLASPASAGTDIVGKAALVDLPAGTLLSPELFSAATPPLGEATVGIRLPVEALPSPALRSGEWVRIVRTDPATGEAREIVPRAMVSAVTAPDELSGVAGDGDGDVVVHVAVPASAADDVAGAASMNGGVRLLGARP
jgi:hypothetical protein